jgi:hypothetical protein
METKIYTFPEIGAVIKEANFKFLSLDTINGERLFAMNSPASKNPINAATQLKRIENWVNSSVCGPGNYFVSASTSMRRTIKPTKFLIHKSDGSGAAPQTIVIHHESEAKPTTLSEGETKLGLNYSLQLITDNATLKAENTRLTQLVNDLIDKVAEYESEEDSLEENPVGAMSGFLSENKEVIFSFIDRFIGTREKRNELEEKNKTPKKVQYVKSSENGGGANAAQIGSDAYLKNLHNLFETNSDAFDTELDKIKISHPELYAKLLLHYNLEEEEETTND